MKPTLFFVLLISLLPSSRCLGNLSGPWHGGQLLIDVDGVKDIAIVREKLRIDLRPLEQGNMIRITATYVIDHSQSPRNLPLTFITGVQSVQGIRCSVDGSPLPFTKKQVREMPESWKPPTQTPGFVPDEQLLYSRSITDTQHEWILFTVPLQTGKQTIEVSYEVEAGSYYYERSTAKYWQTAYILAPARTWKSFGGLDLEVLAPDNWQVKSNLPLVNQGQQWSASFDSLPADFIALTTQHPNGRIVPVIGLRQSLYLFGILALVIGMRHAVHRYREVKQNTGVQNLPPCSQHDSMSLFLLSFLPIVWNVIVIVVFQSSLPSTQKNYQQPVIFAYFQGIYWLIPLVVLILLNRVVMKLFCILGTWLGKRSIWTSEDSPLQLLRTTALPPNFLVSPYPFRVSHVRFLQPTTCSPVYWRRPLASHLTSDVS